MRPYKSQCSVFKGLYGAFLQNKVDGETKEWMKQHERECMHCREWCQGSNENSGNRDYLNSIEVHNEINKSNVRITRVVFTIGIGITVFVMIWMAVSFKI